MAVLIENCGGNFPLWLSPDQIAVLPISEKYSEYANQVFSQLQQLDIRGFIDNRDEKIGKKIRDAEVQKVPFMIIVGEKEEAEQQVSIRRHQHGDLGSFTLSEFAQMFKNEAEQYLQMV